VNNERMPGEPESPRVFISYSHDSPQHEEHVFGLAARLRLDGIDAIIDQYEAFPAKGWNVWMRDQIREARWVLVICTQRYRLRAEGREDAGKGLGATREGSIIDQEIYEGGGTNAKFIPVVLTAADAKHRPDFLRPYQWFAVDTAYEDLYRLLTNQPKKAKPQLGKLRALAVPIKNADYRRPWNIPARNPYFTGRDEYLSALRAAITQSGSPALLPLAISGLGGIGKSQTAVEYAWRYRNEYSAALWTTADSVAAVQSGFAAIAQVLDPPQENERDLNVVARSVMNWFEVHTEWLLVLDNVEDFKQIAGFIPPADAGHVLMTTRLHAAGAVARPLDLNELDPEKGAEFLLRRAGRIAHCTDEDRTAALRIAQQVGGLPLAIDQAGAYIEEAEVSPAEYLALYSAEGERLRSRRGDYATDHESVTNTYTMAMEHLDEATREIVRQCAFLAPEAIPEEILTRGKNPNFAFREAVAKAAKFSLVRRNPDTRSVNIHRLVQEVVKDAMDEPTRRSYAQGVADAVVTVFPWPAYANWPACGRLLANAQVAFELIQRLELKSQAYPRFLNAVGTYLWERSRYDQAEPFYQLGLEMAAKVGADPSVLIMSLNNLAALYRDQNRFEEAERLFLQLRDILEAQDPADTPELARLLSNLGLLYVAQDRLPEAEPELKRALAIREKSLGKDHPDTATTLNNLGGIYFRQERFKEAEPLLRRALEVREKVRGPNNPETGRSVAYLATFYQMQRLYKEAEPWWRRALAIAEQSLGADIPETRAYAHNLAIALRQLDRDDEAQIIEETFKIGS
jgi:tetratricopeptide (TPR) repeat protein